MQALDLEFYPDFADFLRFPETEGSYSSSRPVVQGSVPLSLVDAVIYRRHLDMQYMHLPQAIRQKGGRKPRTRDEDADECPENSVAYEHFRATFDSSRFYSVSKASLASSDASVRQNAVDAFFMPLNSVLNGGDVQEDKLRLKQLQLEITGCEEGLPIAICDGHLTLDFQDDDEGGLSEATKPKPPGTLSSESLQHVAHTEQLQQGQHVFFPCRGRTAQPQKTP